MHPPFRAYQTRVLTVLLRAPNCLPRIRTWPDRFRAGRPTARPGGKKPCLGVAPSRTPYERELRLAQQGMVGTLRVALRLSGFQPDRSTVELGDLDPKGRTRTH